MGEKSQGDFRSFTRAGDIPPQWDIADRNNFLKRDVLSILEKVNPCQQEYYLHSEKRILFVTYRLKLDVFSFQSGFSLKIPVRILGIPLSLSCSGYLCPKEELEFFSRTLDKFHLLLILNTEKELDLPTARTLGTYELDLTKEIVFSGNSRIRLKKARKRGAELSFREMLPSEFGAAHFALYEQVYNRSEGKLEKLNAEYFRQMDAALYEVSHQGKLLAFFQVKQVQDEFIFLFYGVDKEKNLIFDTYLNLLRKIIELAKDGKAKKVHLGQTTSYSKSCVGAVLKERYMYLAGWCLPKWLARKDVTGIRDKVRKSRGYFAGIPFLPIFLKNTGIHLLNIQINEEINRQKCEFI